jgi:acetyl-CoA C-acetyltransferase
VHENLEQNTPILVGAGMVVQKEKDLNKALSPLDLLVAAAQNALQDTGLGQGLLAHIDAVAGLRFITDSPEARGLPFGQYPNPGRSVANRLGLIPRHCFYAPTGGNTPQFMINDMAERIHDGDVETVLLVGGEGLASVMRAVATGVDKSDWNDAPDGDCTGYGIDKGGVSLTEQAHGMSFPVNTYPLLENALRGALGRDVASHAQSMGALMERFTQVAAQHPMSWFPVARSAEELITVSDHNRWVGSPYPKYLNSVIQVDQAAAVILTSVGKAREMGIDPALWVFLHGCADANETWHVSERQDLHRSYAIKYMTEAALNMAGWTADEIDFFDLYSCFPVAVEVACREIGLPEQDARGLTVTGGLPYFGGAGNCYTLLSVATMMQKLRAAPGSKGLCTGNGWYLTKHSIGLYSTAAPSQAWTAPTSRAVQKRIDDLPKRTVDATPNGVAHIDTYSVIHPAGKPRAGLVIGTLEASNARFVAHVADEHGVLDAMLRDEFLGKKGHVVAGEVNYFTPEG